MAIKNGDFVTIEYIGRVDGKIFDITDEATARKENVYRDNTKYGPVTIIVGRAQLIRGIDKALEGKKEGETFDIEIQPDDGFGKKSSKLIKIVPSSTFKSQKINPVPGMQINVDGLIGNIISASSGRIIIDFNHPLAGKVLSYNVSVKKIVTDKRHRIDAVFDIYTGIGPANITLNEEGKKATIGYKTKLSLHDKLRDVIISDIKKYIGFDEVELKEEIIENKKGSESKTNK
ncbi:MAG: peptidylprolyl isomerase [Candidatus Nanoarchaeia archaeon]|nr:peptidylprolyl isomerase [Candidatus Nanoarchaeia archaeon]MDD5239188.1 peptidylprolyl isomerase [Candidatus Nanoarchaeia archaeon]